MTADRATGWVRASALAVLAAGLSAASAQAAQRTDIKTVKNDPGRFKDLVVSFEGVVIVWEEKGTPDVGYFNVRDNYGHVLKVRTVGATPKVGADVEIEGLVVLDPAGRLDYFDARNIAVREAAPPPPPDHSTLYLVLGIGAVLLIGAVILLLLRRPAPTAVPLAAPAAHAGRTDGPAVSGSPPPAAAAPAAGPAGGAPAAALDRTVPIRGRSFSYEQPIDTTLKMLPGRLIVEEQGGKPMEVKLYQVTAEAKFTFGRKEGPKMRHIRIDHPTVSADQAMLVFAGGKFVLTNHSTVNPTVVDGVELGKDESKELKDGSVILMGEVKITLRT